MTLEEKIVKRLTEQGMTLTTAESCTGGLLAQRITNVSGASNVFECGIVSYSNRIKAEVLGVHPETLERFDAVSEETAREMAEGARRKAKASLAVSVTGIAGPSSDDSGKPVGLIYIGLSDGKETIVHRMENHFTENIRENNRRAAADEAFDMIWRYLEYARK